MPLPDLHPKSFRVDNPSPARQPFLCAMIENLGARESGPSLIVVTVDGRTQATAGLAALAAGASREECHRTEPLGIGSHPVSIRVDSMGAVPEMDEYNNVFEQNYVHTIHDDTHGPLGPGVPNEGSASDPNGAPSGPLIGGAATDGGPSGQCPIARTASADLTVTAIRVKGQEPSGNNDCDPGKNDVTVAIKNQGTAPAANFTVRLLVDDDDDEATEKSVASLDADKSLDLTFDDVRLKKGDHKLTAIVDSKTTVTESKEDNNELKATASCKDEGDS